MFYLVGIFRTSSPGDSISSNPEKTAPRRLGEKSGYIEVCNKGQFCVYMCVCSVAKLCLTLCDPNFPCSSLSLRVYSNSCHYIGDAIQPSHPLSSPFPTAFNLTQHQGFFRESAHCIRWPKNWSFSFSISSSNEYSGLISFRIDWFDLFVQGTLKSLLQHHNSKASVLCCSAFFMI